MEVESKKMRRTIEQQQAPSSSSLQMRRTMEQQQPSSSSLHEMDLKHSRRKCGTNNIDTKDAAFTQPAVVTQTAVTQRRLPHDVIVNILSRLPVKSLVRSRSVCKEWFSLTNDAYFVEEQQERARDRLPTLISSSINKRVACFNFGDGGNMYDSSFEIGSWEESSYVLSDSVNGLACACDAKNEGRNFYLLNPSTREYSKLPMNCHEDLEEESIGFGFDASSGEYKVVRILSGKSRKSCACEVLTLGTAGWRFIGETPCTLAFDMPVFLDGVLHWKAFFPEGNGHQLAILTFDIKQEEFGVISAPKSKSLRGSLQVDIRELRGHLCVVAIFHCEPQLRIWKLMDNSKWVIMYNIETDSCTDLGVAPTLLGTAGKMLLLEVPRNDFSAVIYCYDVKKRNFHQIYEGASANLFIHEESLLSPRKLLGDRDMVDGTMQET